MTRLSATTASKINLHLRIVGPRADGYHDLDTRFQTIDLGDGLTIEEAERLSLEVDDPAIPAGPENLVWRAAELLRAESRVTSGARMLLAKRVPAGGGLGGGSGDAAAALLLLDRLWRLALPAERLADLAAKLGSDVPFFLAGGTVRACGRGEILEPEPDLPAEEILLLIPPVSLPTPAVYRDFAAHEGASLTSPGGAPRILPLDESSSNGNDLEPAVFRLAPTLAPLRDRLFAIGARAAFVSGSGACLFGRFPGRRVPAGAEDAFAGMAGARRVRFLSRDDYFRRLGLESPAGRPGA